LDVSAAVALLPTTHRRSAVGFEHLLDAADLVNVPAQVRRLTTMIEPGWSAAVTFSARSA